MLQAPLRSVLIALEPGENVLADDAKNLGLYLHDVLRSLPHIELVDTPEAMADFSRKLNYQNSATLRRLGNFHLIEAVLGGKVNHYSYQKDRKHLLLNLEITLFGLNTYTGERFFELNRRFERRYRIRNARNKDFSGYNRKFLDEVFAELMLEFHRRVYALAEAQKQRHGGVLPTRLVSAEKSSSTSQPQLMHVMLWPVNDEGNPENLSRPIRKRPSVSGFESRIAKKTGGQETAASSPGARSQVKMAKRNPSSSWRERAKELARKFKQRRKQASKDQPLKESTSTKAQKEKIVAEVSSKANAARSVEVSKPRFSENFNLEMPGFQLVYPPKYSKSKKYQKFYFLLDGFDRGDSKAMDLDSAPEETLVLEVFSTVDEKAVTRFMEDYFHGVKSNPRGKIPELFERNYVGKYQVGFKLEDKAVIATGHRGHRDLILDGLSGLYVNNGGISVARIINRSFKKGRRAADIVFEDIQAAKAAMASKPQPVRSHLKKRRQIATASSAPAKKIVRGAKPKASMEPSSSAPRRVTTKTRRKNQKDNLITEILKPKTKEPPPKPDPSHTEFPANAVFFFDMARGYFQSGDFDTAQRYFKLAKKHGYDVPELHGYLQRILEETGKVPTNPPTDSSAMGKSTPGSLEYEEYDYARWRERAQETRSKSSISPFPAPKGRLEGQKTAPGVQQAPPMSPPTKVIPPKEPLKDFYQEMQKMENEIQRYMKGKSRLTTIAKYPERISLTEFLIQVIFLVASTLFIISIVSSQKLR
jgi:hypothetical protein